MKEKLVEKVEDENDDVVIIHQMTPPPTLTLVAFPNKPEKVPMTIEIQTKWDNPNVETQAMMEEIMKTKKLRGGKLVEKFMKEKVEEEQQANHTSQEQVNGTQPTNST